MSREEYIKNLIAQSGRNIKEFASDVDIPYTSMLSMLKNLGGTAIDSVMKICKGLNITVEHLDKAAQEGTLALNTTPYNPSSMVPIPVIGKVAAGVTCLAETNIETYMLADVTNLNRNYDYAWLRVTGDSMEPFILDGDYVLVQMQSMVNNGDIAVVIINGDDGLVKKILLEKDCITLISSNPYYPPRKFIKEEMNEVRIFGKVIESKRIF